MYGFWGLSSSFIMVDRKTWSHEKYKSQGNILIFYKRSLVSCFSTTFSFISLLLKILKGVSFWFPPPVTLFSKNPSTFRVKWSQYLKIFSTLFSSWRLFTLEEKINNLIVCRFASPHSFRKELEPKSELGWLTRVCR